LESMKEEVGRGWSCRSILDACDGCYNTVESVLNL
jgi:hypothetical protein